MTRLFLLFFSLPLSAFQLPSNCQQAIVGIASDWKSSHVTLHLYEKDAQGQWHLASQPWKGRLGGKGLAWGIGLHPSPAGETTKKEGDRKAPAGIFKIGGAFGYEENIQRNPALPYLQITTRDLFVEDSSSKYYNRHLRLNHEPKSSWEKKQQMRQNDHAHSLKLFIKHNLNPQALPHAGSAIFFHIWRKNGAASTFGCTTMHEQNLRTLIAWVNPSKNPLYILLPEKDYLARRSSWQLP
ncbi:MAG: L,D-transpeptidase family protein [Verrucomicrobiota bacterium]